jgi:PAS domain S-box-containing protein
MHPGGAIQPHGLLLVLQGPELRIVQASANSGPMLRRPLDTLLLATLRDLGGGLEARVRELLAAGLPDDPQWLEWRCGAGADAPIFEGHVHRVGPDAVALELEPGSPVDPPVGEAQGRELLRQLGGAVQRFSVCPSLEGLAESAVQAVRALTGHADVRVLVCDEAGRTQLLAGDGAHGSLAAAPPRLAPGAAAEHLRQRVRLLVDLQKPAVELLPQRPPEGGAAFDLGRSRLRAAAPGHVQRLGAQGVRAALSIAVVREGRLWGLIEARHGRARHLDSRRLAACELLAEAMATRIAAIENHAQAALAGHVRRFEQRLLAAAAADGDWRAALRRENALLLQPLDARGALLLHDGATQGCGETPDAPGLQALRAGLQAAAASDEPVLSAWWRWPGAAGPQAVLAVPLSATRTDWLLWLRPALPGASTDDAAWSTADRALAQAYGQALAQLIVQVDAVRLLIAQQQLVRMREAVAGASDAVVVADTAQRAVYANAAFLALAGCGPEACTSLRALAALFTDAAQVWHMMDQVRGERRAWRGELVLRRASDGAELPVAVRAEPVPTRDDALLGTVFVFTDLRAAKRAEAAREQLETALSRAARAGGRAAPGPVAAVEKELVGALVTNASLAAMDIADGSPAPTMAPLLEEVGASTARATALLARIRRDA